MKVLTTGQVRQLLGVAPRTVAGWIDSGQLPGFRVPGSRHRRIPVVNVVRFASAHNIPLQRQINLWLVLTFDESLLKFLKPAAEAKGFALGIIQCAFDAGYYQDKEPVGVVVDLDYSPMMMPLYERIVEHGTDNQMPVIFTGQEDQTAVAISSTMDWFKKPFDVQLLIESMAKLAGWE